MTTVAPELQREVDKWLIKNQVQMQFMLQEDNLKELLYEIFQEGVLYAARQKKMEVAEDVFEDVEHITNYSSLLTENL